MHSFRRAKGYLISTTGQPGEIVYTYLTSAFVLVEEQKPTWKQSMVPDLAHGQQAASECIPLYFNVKNLTQLSTT